MFQYLRDRFPTARVMDPANTNNVISDDLNDADRAKIRAAAVAALAASSCKPVLQMTGWSLPTLLSALHDGVAHRLKVSREAMAHPVLKGDASEAIWLDLLQTYLPARYQAARAVVVDSENRSSDQLDVVVFDRQYSPFVFLHEGVTVIPAESVYAVFEAKQNLDAGQVDYAHGKIASVRALRRTSLPIPHAGGTFPARPLPWIIGGILTH